MKFACLLLALPLVAACERKSETPTAEESRQLDDAANLLDQAPGDLDRVDDSSLNAATPEDNQV